MHRGLGACSTRKNFKGKSSGDDSEHVLRQQTKKLQLWNSQTYFLAVWKCSQLETGSYNAIYFQPEGSCAFFCMTTTNQSRQTQLIYWNWIALQSENKNAQKMNADSTKVGSQLKNGLAMVRPVPMPGSSITSFLSKTPCDYIASSWYIQHPQAPTCLQHCMESLHTFDTTEDNVTPL